MATHTERLPWPVFARRLVLLCFLVGAPLAYLGTRYRLGIDWQTDRCLPDTSVYLIDRWNRVPLKEGLYAFEARGLTPWYADGTRMLKRLTGMPGEVVEVNHHGIQVETRQIGEGLVLAAQLGQPPEAFHRTHILDEGQYWFSGDAPTSFDSRYWGPVSGEQLLGRAWPLW
jgi:conjugal transfer pilin signal peptidase TrbI